MAMYEQVIAGMRLVGFSLGGEESVVIAPEFNVCFDIGRAPRESISIDNILLTHGHMDHAAGVAYYFSQRTFVGLQPGRVVVHRSLAQSIQKLMDIWSDIEGHPSPGTVWGIQPFEDVAIRRGLVARAFAVNHSPASLGFTLIERRHKLRAEFASKSGPELVALKRQGVVIDEEVEVPLLTYTGDTALGRFLDLDFVRNSRVVITECTFFDREHKERARAGRHIHVDELPRILEALPEPQIMLVHTTKRTDFRLCKRMVQKVLKPADLERVVFLMDAKHRARATPEDQAAELPQQKAGQSG